MNNEHIGNTSNEYPNELSFVQLISFSPSPEGTADTELDSLDLSPSGKGKKLRSLDMSLTLSIPPSLHSPICIAEKMLNA
jgi:hypothetical protein